MLSKDVDHIVPIKNPNVEALGDEEFVTETCREGESTCRGGWTGSSTRSSWLRNPESNAPDNKWIRMLSRGGLYLPSAELKQLVDSMETDFQKYYGPSLSLEKHSMNILAKILQLRNPGAHLDLLQLFSRARFYMRLKYLNKELKVHEKSIQRRYTIHVNKFV